ncbi:uncharacterized mitochondrial protein AtMg00810-like [Amblyraja radiata]|uniref:uncharacterized mitochondrial protein AtMg00810-like n=1 Tax=Amblyraja radiata TaxID=386614 RepID=UPI0014025DEB|nr:uncharacterized mitochondrial protein AtMg00810-like [Amblyraja radiata]
MLHEYLTENDFVQNPADHCVYTRETENEKVIMIIWVNYLIIAASDEKALKAVKEMLTAKFKMKDMGKLKHFLGIDFYQSDNCVRMSQKKYVEKILERFDMQDCKPRATPCEQKLNYTDDAEMMTDVRKYREVVGSLIYLTTCTRPDLSFVVSKLSQYFTELTEKQWATVKHVLRYLRGTIEKELCYKKCDDEKLALQAYSDADWAADVTDRCSTTGYCVSLNKNGPLISWKNKKCDDEKLALQAYSDADWAADVTDRRSTTGYCVSLNKNGPLISWKNKKQPTVALSTCEAEYMVLAATLQVHPFGVA